MAKRAKALTLAQQLVMKLMLAFGILSKVLPAGVRGLPVLTGLTAKHYIDPQEVVLHKASELLKNSQRVFRFENGIFLEVTQVIGPGKRLVPLMTDGKLESAAVALLSTLFAIKQGDRTIPITFWFAGHLLHSDQLRETLPAIRHYARRPDFDPDFNLCGPGWDEKSGTLIHGQDVEPDMRDYSQQGPSGLDRLPPHLHQLLRRFCFASPADLANILGMLLTGLLANHFLVEQKAMCLVDGNQCNLGKTLLVRAVGAVIDGVDPTPVAYTPNDEELAKRVCADIRSNRQSVVIIDNAKTARGLEISSPFLEANAVAPVISMRILGLSQNYVKQNGLLWFLTMNQTRASRDLITRSVVVQLHHEGDPSKRDFQGFDPIGYAMQNRFQILGELAGLVIRWNQQGRPEGQQKHRLQKWAKVIGGILQVAGYPDFLANADEVAGSFTSELDQLASLAEAAVRQAQFVLAHTPSAPITTTQKLAPRDWVELFVSNKLLPGELLGKSPKSQTVKIGQFFAPFIGREVEFELDGQVGKATLKSEPGRSKSKRYYFDLTWQPAPASNTADQVVPQSEAVMAPPPEAVQAPPAEPVLATPPPCGQQGSVAAKAKS